MLVVVLAGGLCVKGDDQLNVVFVGGGGGGGGGSEEPPVSCYVMLCCGLMDLAGLWYIYTYVYVRWW